MSCFSRTRYACTRLGEIPASQVTSAASRNRGFVRSARARAHASLSPRRLASSASSTMRRRSSRVVAPKIPNDVRSRAVTSGASRRTRTLRAVVAARGSGRSVDWARRFGASPDWTGGTGDVRATALAPRVPARGWAFSLAPPLGVPSIATSCGSFIASRAWSRIPGPKASFRWARMSSAKSASCCGASRWPLRASERTSSSSPRGTAEHRRH